MNMKKKFFNLFIIFGILNLIDFSSTAICVFLPGFEEMNPLVSAVIVNSIGLFFGLKVAIIFLIATAGGILFSIGDERGIWFFTQGLAVMDMVLAMVCGCNIGQLIYYMNSI
jgi:hypothetical protein